MLQPLRSFLTTLSFPLVLIADAPLTISEWLGDVSSSRDDLQIQNNKLAETNLQLQAKLQKFESLEAENLRLRNLLDSSFKVGERVLIAELSSVELDPFSQKVVINKGERSGAFVGQPVLDAHAVMGQVIHTSSVNSTVLLITDASHALPVQVLRNGLRTIVVGTGEIDRLNLPFLPRNADIVEGDMLVTSGLGGKFPAGYPVARISKVTLEAGQHFATIVAEPLAHLDRSREVLLVWQIKVPPAISSASNNETSAATASDISATTTSPDTIVAEDSPE